MSIRQYEEAVEQASQNYHDDMQIASKKFHAAIHDALRDLVGHPLQEDDDYQMEAKRT